MSSTEATTMETDTVLGAKRHLDETTESKQEEPPAKRARVDAEARNDDATEEKQEADAPRVTVAMLQEMTNELQEVITSKKCAPILVRLAWHDAGTYCAESKSGGPRACMRHDGGEAAHGANAGLNVAREILAPIVEKYGAQGVSTADIWALAGCVGVKSSGGPDIAFRFGRKDAPSAEEATQDGRLPDATQGADHLRQVFGRMGFETREIVALSGAHSIGQCHAERSGFEGAWTAEPLVFDNSYFADLVNKKWTKGENEKGLPQYKSEDGTLMLMSDYALVEDDDMKAVLQVYVGDQGKFFEDFAGAFKKLIELGYDSLYEPSS